MEIEDVKQKLEATQAQAEAKQRLGKNEVGAKIDALCEQMAVAGVRQKAMIEKHLAEAKADYQARSAKLELAKRLIQEALSA